MANDDDSSGLPVYTHYIACPDDDATPPNEESNAAPQTNATTPVVNPASQRPSLLFVPSTPADVRRAVSAAHAAFHARDADAAAWSHPSQRRRRATVLRSVADLLRKNTDRLADLEVRQIGRPRKEMRFQLGRLPEWFEYYASLIDVREDSVTPFGPGYLNVVQRVPLGVVAQITPFNHPLLIAVKKLAPALAAGNCVVTKPSELAPASVVELAKLCGEAGVPPGVFSVVLGGSEVGEALVGDERIAKVDFTGGPQAGRAIGAKAGQNLCGTTLELGGKAPVIVFGPPGGVRDEEDLDKYLQPIVNGAAFAAFIASGQTCIAGTRILIEDSIYDAFARKLVEKTKVFRMGDPESMDTTIGPVITKKQLAFIEEQVKEGAQSEPALEILCGGSRYTEFEGKDAHLNEGNWYEPTVVAARRDALPDEASIDRLHSSNALFQTELFGPVVALAPFRSQAQAVRLANGTSFGLGCSIWTSDLARAHRVAEAVHAGIVWINDHHKNHPSSPWGGLTKESGVGRENGADAFAAYTQAKSVVFNTGRFESDWFRDPDARYN